MQTRNLIRDGQTRKGVIAAVDNLNQGLAFEYRPMLPLEYQTLSDAIDRQAEKKRSDEITRYVAAALVKHLVSWSEVDEKGNPVPINLPNMLLMPYPIIKAVYDIIAGFKPSDAITDGGSDEEEDQRIQRLLEGVDGFAQLEADTKN